MEKLRKLFPDKYLSDYKSVLSYKSLNINDIDENSNNFWIDKFKLSNDHIRTALDCYNAINNGHYYDNKFYF